MKFNKYKSTNGILLIFSMLMLMAFNAKADSIQKIPISIDPYSIEVKCGGIGGRGDFIKTEFYVLHIKSKNVRFQNYLQYEKSFVSGQKQLEIKTKLEDIFPSVNFRNKADVDIVLSGVDFQKLIDAKRFLLIYPTVVFGEDFKEELWGKTHMADFNTGYFPPPYSTMYDGNFLFYSNLILENAQGEKETCSKQILEAQKKHEKDEAEANKPINRLKKFFNID